MIATDDLILICQACNSEFAFSRREQQFFERRGLASKPKRCGECRRLFRMTSTSHELPVVGDQALLASQDRK